jgi:hemoglobin
MAQSLFEKYGGFARLSRIVGLFYDKVLDSEVIGDFFEGVDMRRLIDHQTKFVAAVMGGPAQYSDEVLGQLHAHLAIEHHHFDEMIRLMRETLDEAGFTASDTAFVVEAIEARRASIVRRGG